MIKFCDRCNYNTAHRFVKNETNGYYSCKICLETNSKKHRKLHWPRYLAQKANARNRPGSSKLLGHEVEAQFLKQNSKCALTGQNLDINHKWWKPSLDRIDSNKGYSVDNIRIVAWIVNHCRGDLEDAEFIDMCKKVADN